MTSSCAQQHLAKLCDAEQVGSDPACCCCWGQWDLAPKAGGRHELPVCVASWGVSFKDLGSRLQARCSVPPSVPPLRPFYSAILCRKYTVNSFLSSQMTLGHLQQGRVVPRTWFLCMSPPGSVPLPFLLRSCVQAKGINGRFLSPCCKIRRNGRSTGADNDSSSPSFTAMVAEPEWTGLFRVAVN